MNKEIVDNIYRSRLECIEKAIGDMVAQGEKPSHSFDEFTGTGTDTFYVFESGRTLRVRDEWSQDDDGYMVRTVVEEVPPKGSRFIVRLGEGDDHA